MFLSSMFKWSCTTAASSFLRYNDEARHTLSAHVSSSYRTCSADMAHQSTVDSISRPWPPASGASSQRRVPVRSLREGLGSDTSTFSGLYEHLQASQSISKHLKASQQQASSVSTLSTAETAALLAAAELLPAPGCLRFVGKKHDLHDGCYSTPKARLHQSGAQPWKASPASPGFPALQAEERNHLGI